MKKKLTTLSKIGLLLFSMAFIFSSCTKDDDDIHETDWDVFAVTAKSTSWQWEGGDEHGLYFTDIDAPELTAEKAKNGGIQVARVIGNNAFKPLPYTEYLFDNVIGYYAQTVDFEYKTGYIRLYVKQSDLYDKTPNDVIPNTMDFKVTIFY